MVPNTSCKKILELIGGNENKVYRINPSGAKAFNVYCDMQVDN